VQQPVAQLLGFGDCQLAVQQKVLGPGEQVDSGLFLFSTNPRSAARTQP
jgi:hypothetical protein